MWISKCASHHQTCPSFLPRLFSGIDKLFTDNTEIYDIKRIVHCLLTRVRLMAELGDLLSLVSRLKKAALDERPVEVHLATGT